MRLSQLHPNDGQIEGVPRNPRQITKEEFAKLKKSLKNFRKMLPLRPIVVDEGMNILGGNMRYQALKKLAEEGAVCQVFDIRGALVSYFKFEDEIPDEWVKVATDLTPDEKMEFIVKDNEERGQWDYDLLANDWDAEKLREWDIEAANWDIPEEETKQEENHSGNLAKKFIVPPFSILDSRQGYWMERKKMWKALIQDNGESREETLGDTMLAGINNGVSILDPVLSELVCKWFGITGGKCFDTFAGDTIFGYVSSKLGMQFTGIELREEQAAINNKRTKELNAKYICDDGCNVEKHIESESQDLFFSCPPYYDLEVYSELPNDASNQASYKDFLSILKKAFTGAVRCLKDNRFAVIVVGDIRNKQGFYYNFPNDIKNIFAELGLPLYNELVLVEPIGTLPQRAGRYMLTRKIGKCHQNVLVFYKGNPDKIKLEYEPIEYNEEELNGSKDLE